MRGDSKGQRYRASPRARRRSRELNVDLAHVKGSGPEGRIVERDVLQFAESAVQSDSSVLRGDNDFARKERSDVRITPVARKWSEMHGVSMDQLQRLSEEHRGRGRRLYLKDVQYIVSHAKNGRKTIDQTDKIVPFSTVRKKISAAVSENALTRPHVTLHTEVKMGEVERVRASLIPRPSYTDIFVKVVAETLRNHHVINSSYSEEGIIMHGEVNIGIAVALDEGLIVPVIHGADRLSINQLSRLTRDLITKAREGRLSVDDVTRGTFTISNLGMFDVDGFTPILHDNQSAILGVGRIVNKVIAENSLICSAPVVTLSLTFDHRVMDGAPAARFLTELKERLEWLRAEDLVKGVEE